MCNYYATTSGYPIAHAFASRRERDEWTREGRTRRDAVDAGEALRLVRCRARIILHGDARIPRSWSGSVTGHRCWDYMRTEDPNIDYAYLIP